MDSSSQPKLNIPDSPMLSIESDSDFSLNNYPNDSNVQYESAKDNMNNDSKLIIKKIDVDKTKRF